MDLRSKTAQGEKLILLQWEVGVHDTLDVVPEQYVPAGVPGAVQLDSAKTEGYPDYRVAENVRRFDWMEKKYWTYRASFAKPELESQTSLYFVSQGIDYQFQIYFNGEKIHEQEGMFTPVRLDLTDRLQDQNEILIKLFPVPIMVEEPVDHHQASHVAKPAVSYGWDWHPRLVPLGIWDDTYLEVRPLSHITQCLVQYGLSKDLSEAELSIPIHGRHLMGNKVKWYIRDREDHLVLQGECDIESNEPRLRGTIHDIRLWWPHDHGEPYLYTLDIELLDANGHTLQTVQRRVGFRRVRLVMNEGTWDEPKTFPKSRSCPPITLEINGRRIFCKGSNWVNPEIFPGLITRETYEALLDKAKACHFNILRVWGGGIVNKESFFEICDEKGLMVWQDFPLACNQYVESESYLKVLEQEAKSIIKRLQWHPSVVLWCGGNELFNDWSLMTDQSPALRLLNSLCYQLDPHTPFLPTTPVMGMGHGHYVFYDKVTDEDVFQVMKRARNTAYTEFGMPGPSNEEVIRSCIPEEELFPPKPGKSWEVHHGFNAWQGDTWLMPQVIERYFGQIDYLSDLIRYGQLLQCEGVKCIYESARRQKPYCSMALNWCYNEPWPTAANNSLINYPCFPKPAYYAVQNACRPILVSAAFERFVWEEGMVFECDLWILNDSYQARKPIDIDVYLEGDEKRKIGQWQSPTIPTNTNVAGPTLRVDLPHWKCKLLKVCCEVQDFPEWNSEYTLVYQPKLNSQERRPRFN